MSDAVAQHHAPPSMTDALPVDTATDSDTNNDIDNEEMVNDEKEWHDAPPHGTHQHENENSKKRTDDDDDDDDDGDCIIDKSWYDRYRSAFEDAWQHCRQTGSSKMMTSAMILVSAVAAIIWYEIQIQRRLTAPPIVYGQIDDDSPDRNYNHNKRFDDDDDDDDDNNGDHENSIGSNNTSNTTVIKQRQKPLQQYQYTYHHPFSYITSSDIYQHLIQQSKQYQNNNIIQRPIQPSLFVGTRAHISSTMAYLIQQHYQHDNDNGRHRKTATGVSQLSQQQRQQQRYLHDYHYDKKHHTVQFREIMKMPTDGATIAIDWKFHYNTNSNNHDNDNTDDNNNMLSIDEWIHQILYGPISLPVVLILHGINNHTNFGYIQSMMNACCSCNSSKKKGPYIAAGMNFRGCAIRSDNNQAPNNKTIFLDSTTPRTYNGAYTGDIRTVVQKISQRLLVIVPGSLSTASSSNNTFNETELVQQGPTRSKYQPLFLVGNSLGANLLTKYLGEEGRCGTLHPCIAGGVTMGNPSHIDSRNASPLISPLIAMGAKRGLYQIYPTMKAMVRSSSYFRQCMKKGWRAITLADYDNAMAPIFCRNEPSYPFQYQIGYHNSTNDQNAAMEYWNDASSYRQVPHISVPFLQLIARDDFLTYRSFRDRLYYNIINPYVMVMETTCGGHLGWHEAVMVENDNENRGGPWSWSKSVLGTSWADVAMIDFIQAILELHVERQLQCASAGTTRTSTNEFTCNAPTDTKSNDGEKPNQRSRL